LRGYELCIIIHPDAADTDIDGIISSLSESISKHKGRVHKTDKWGRKNFKYPIKKQSKGYYCFIYYTGNNEIIRDIERLVKFNELILRYNTIRMDKNFPIVEEVEVEVEVEVVEVAEAQTPEPVTEEETKGEGEIKSETGSEDDSKSPSETPTENGEEVTPESNE